MLINCYHISIVLGLVVSPFGKFYLVNLAICACNWVILLLIQQVKFIKRNNRALFYGLGLTYQIVDVKYISIVHLYLYLKQNNKLWYQNDVKMTPKWLLKDIFQSFPIYFNNFNVIITCSAWMIFVQPCERMRKYFKTESMKRKFTRNNDFNVD